MSAADSAIHPAILASIIIYVPILASIAHLEEDRHVNVSLFHLLNELLSPTITQSYEGPICGRIPRCKKISRLLSPGHIALQIMRAYRRNEHGDGLKLCFFWLLSSFPFCVCERERERRSLLKSWLTSMSFLPTWLQKRQ